MGVAQAGWLTRGQVARRLGLSVASVRRFEGSRLHPRCDEHGVWLFDPEEVRGLAAERARRDGGDSKAARLHEGDLAARVFELFEAGRSLSAIVRELHEEPAKIRRLHREWRAGFGDPDGDGDDSEIEAARRRDEAELAAWEEEMRAAQRRENELDAAEREHGRGTRGRLRERRAHRLPPA
jgi:hypothetical protein